MLVSLPDISSPTTLKYTTSNKSYRIIFYFTTILLVCGSVYGPVTRPVNVGAWYVPCLSAWGAGPLPHENVLRLCQYNSPLHHDTCNFIMVRSKHLLPFLCLMYSVFMMLVVKYRNKNLNLSFCFACNIASMLASIRASN